MIARRRHGMLHAAAGLAQGLALVPLWLAAPRWSPAALRYERGFMARLARRMVSRIACSGAAPAGAGTLFVANHISWLDIPVLGSVLDAGFIAKSDVRGWPLIDTLARRSGTLFVARDARHQVHHQAAMIADRLKAGNSLVLFAEGTTSDGVEIRPFRTSLFEAAQHAGCIQPVAIGYHRGDGARLGDDQLRQIGWADDEPMQDNLRRVLAMHLSAEVRLAPAFVPAPGLSRKALAEQCRDAVAAAHAAIRGTA